VLDRPIIVAEYDPAWPRLYEQEAARICPALGDAALLIEHVGSTAVPRLAAKPRTVVTVTSNVVGHNPIESGLPSR
jgi:GrpB-like predicted nucleotidyltransferase (UPF0157 family)